METLSGSEQLVVKKTPTSNEEGVETGKNFNERKNEIKKAEFIADLTNEPSDELTPLLEKMYNDDNGKIKMIPQIVLFNLLEKAAQDPKIGKALLVALCEEMTDRTVILDPDMRESISKGNHLLTREITEEDWLVRSIKETIEEWLVRFDEETTQRNESFKIEMQKIIESSEFITDPAHLSELYEIGPDASKQRDFLNEHYPNTERVVYVWEMWFIYIAGKMWHKLEKDSIYVTNLVGIFEGEYNVLPEIVNKIVESNNI